MQHQVHFRRAAGVAALLAGLAGALPARAESATDFARRYETEARSSNPGYAGSAARGAEFFRSRHGQDWSCSTCHTDNPAAPGQHATTNKPIDPLAPLANAERFTRADKVEKWFKRNCNDVLGRVCSAAEKGDVLAYLMTVKK